MSSTKLAFISQYFFPEQFSNNEIVAELVRRGYDVDVVCCVPNYPSGIFFDGYSNGTKREDTWHGARIHRAWTIPRGKSNLQLIANYLAFVFAGSFTAARRIHGRPDVTLVSMPSPLFQALVGIFLKWRRKTPLVIWVQDIWPESVTYNLGIESPYILKPFSKLCGWIYRQADLVLVQSKAFPEKIQRFGVPTESIRYFPNTAPANYRPLSPDDAPAEAALVPQKGFRVMFAGNIGESQDFDTILAAAVRLKDVEYLQWVIVGSGRDMARVQCKVEKLELTENFHFLGRHPEARMPYFFAHADAMLVSLKRNDIFALTVPYKIQCYMACGKPIIASIDGEGAKVINEAGAGWTVPSETPEALEGKIRELMALSQNERLEVGQNAIEYFKRNFSQAIVYAQLDDWLKEAAGSNSASASEGP